MSSHLCVDCVAGGQTSARPIVNAPSRTPLCFTHHRARKREQRSAKRAAEVQRTRGVSATDGADLLRFQGGLCWFCRRATGATKALAFDHDHKHCSGKTSCATCLRGRLCGPCNQMLGHLRDDADAFQRVADYLRGDTPWNRLRASRQVFSVGDVVQTNRIATEFDGLYWFRCSVDRINPEPPDGSKRTVFVGVFPNGGWWYDPMHLEMTT